MKLSIALALSAVPACLSAQSLPPVRQLGPVTAVSKEPLSAVSTVRSVSGGRVLVNDIVGRRVVMFDSSLATATVVADTTSATAQAYGTRAGGLIPYRGDSTLFVDPASLSMLLIDPDGKIARVMSAPPDVGFLVGGPFGNPGFDPAGRLVYRAPPNFRGMVQRLSGRPEDFPTPPDSAALVRFDLATRKLDTATFFKTPKINMQVGRSPDGGVRVQSMINPLPQGDDWAMLPDGTIALVRGRDFHIDWLSPDGKVTASPKIPFNWERLTDEGKVALLDSAKTAMEKARASGQFGGDAAGGPVIGFRNGPDGGGPGGGGRDGRRREGGDAPRTDVATPAPNAQAGTITVQAGGTTVTAVGPGAGGRPLEMVSPSELPDYRPAFRPGSTRVDPDGNLWIRTNENIEARPVYDVVNRKGELFDRVQIPANRALIGFGPGGAVYLAVRDGNTAHLEKARVK